MKTLSFVASGSLFFDFLRLLHRVVLQFIRHLVVVSVVLQFLFVDLQFLFVCPNLFVGFNHLYLRLYCIHSFFLNE
jgi:hypothetical protein